MHTEVDGGMVLGTFSSRRDLLNFVGPSRSISVEERFHITSRGHVVVLNNGGHVSVPNKSCWSVLKWDVIFKVGYET